MSSHDDGQPAPSHPIHAFRKAVETQDHAALLQALAPDVIFHSPIVYHDYTDRDAVAPVLAAVMDVFVDAAGLVRELTVMVRPYSAATALRAAMAAKLAAPQGESPAW